MKLLRLNLAVVAACPLFAAVAQNDRPNIIFLMTDDQAFNTIAALSDNRQIQTPNLDRLVAEGVTFARHYATSSISVASRAQVMTGMYEYHTGCNFMHGGLTAEKFALSYPVLLRENGYYTGFAGKFGIDVIDANSDGTKGFDRLPVCDFDKWGGGPRQTSYVTAENHFMKQYAEEFPHSSRSYGAFGRDFLDEAKASGKPFCLSISFKAPHFPKSPDPIFDYVYSKSSFPIPASAEDADERLPLQARLGRQFLVSFGGNLHGGDFEAGMRKYHQLIYGVDYAIGMILERLEQLDMVENTIIIFTADNGYALGTNRFGGKVLPYEHNSRIPLIVFDPRSAAAHGERSESLTANIDIAPTILDYAGVEAPQNMDGHSLRSIVERPSRECREDLPLINVWGSPGCFSLSVVADGMKYIYWGFADKMEPVEELFDLAKDPEERCNVAGERRYASKIETMRKIYDKHLADWQATCCDYNDYKPFATILSREIPWSERKALIPQEYWDFYLKMVSSKEQYGDDPYNYEEVARRRL